MKKKNYNKFPSLLSISNGKPDIINVKKLIKCKKCNKEIESGSNCFCMSVSQSGFSNTKRYCLHCGLKIIENSEAQLLEIKKTLNDILNKE